MKGGGDPYKKVCYHINFEFLNRYLSFKVNAEIYSDFQCENGINFDNVERLCVLDPIVFTKLRSSVPTY